MSPEILSLDWETFSCVDLRKAGLHVYAVHPSTDIICLGWAFDDEPVEIWHPKMGDVPARVVSHLKAGGWARAFNAVFEMQIAKYVGPRYGFPPIRPEQTICTMVQGLAMGLPGSLENSAAALGIEQRKDLAGGRVMLQCSKPREVFPDGTYTRWDDEERLSRVYEYCRQDVEVEREVARRTLPLSPYERRVWVLDQKINDTGIQVDVPAVKRAIELVEGEKIRLNAEMRAASDNQIATCTAVQQIKDYLEFFGVSGEALDKTAVAEHLLKDLPPAARRILELRAEAGKASTSKFAPMAGSAGADGRLRGMFQYSGANTRRWAGRRVQLHNLLRGKLKPEVVDAIITDLLAGASAAELSLYYGSPLTILGDCTRSFLMAAPGKELLVADFSAIEARVLAWLAGQEDVLNVFRDGKDIYKAAAAQIFGNVLDKVTDDQRQVGKVAILACLAAETKVLTSDGVKCLNELSINDQVWDGVEWVHHEGLVARGVRPTVNVAGTWVTPDHLILTGKIWIPAEKLASSPYILRQALETASENLPLWDIKEARTGLALTIKSKLAVRAARLRIWYMDIISEKALLLDASLVLKKARAVGEKVFINMRPSYQTMPTAGDFATVCRPASSGATVPKVRCSITTVAEAFTFSRNGDGRHKNFSDIWSRWMDGIFLNWKSIVLTLTKVTNQGICDFVPEKKIRAIKDLFLKCKSESSNSRPVFDILNAGVRNRFTILTSAGPLLVHNCGYGGGVGAFQTMAKAYNVKMEPAFMHLLQAATPEQRIRAQKTWESNKNKPTYEDISEREFIASDLTKIFWRENNPRITAFWEEIEGAAINAVEHPGQFFGNGKVRFRRAGSFLWCRLPSGGVICYPYPEIKDVKTPWGSQKRALTYMSEDGQTRKWQRFSTYGGSLAENITQAVARDLLADAMLRLDEKGFNIVAHIHDEIICEMPKGVATLQDMIAVMVKNPTWAAGLPLKAAGFVTQRYRK